MNINEMSVKQFRELPSRENWNDKLECRSIVILPGGYRDLHDSGYRLMDFVAVDGDNEPICRFSGCSDVVHLGGIGPTKAVDWSIDCLPKSGLLRIFCRKTIIVGPALSSMEIWTE